MPSSEDPQQRLEIEVQRGRPGRRTADERQAAVLDTKVGGAPAINFVIRRSR